jgi:transcriptional regulator with XRE-family HTH domain
MAMDAACVSARALALWSDAAAGTGASYSTVYRILAGKTEPSLRFVAEVARRLDVSPVWLAFGVGAPPIDTTHSAIAAAIRTLTAAGYSVTLATAEPLQPEAAVRALLPTT